jgi:hypothetical protein
MVGESIFFTLSTLWFFIAVVAVLVSGFTVMNERKGIPDGWREDAPASSQIVILTAILSFLGPVIVPLVFTIGWKDKFPKRMRTVYWVGWPASILALIILVFLYIILHLV